MDLAQFGESVLYFLTDAGGVGSDARIWHDGVSVIVDEFPELEFGLIAECETEAADREFLDNVALGGVYRFVDLDECGVNGFEVRPVGVGDREASGQDAMFEGVAA